MGGSWSRGVTEVGARRHTWSPVYNRGWLFSSAKLEKRGCRRWDAVCGATNDLRATAASFSLAATAAISRRCEPTGAEYDHARKPRSGNIDLRSNLRPSRQPIARCRRCAAESIRRFDRISRLNGHQVLHVADVSSASFPSFRPCFRGRIFNLHSCFLPGRTLISEPACFGLGGQQLLAGNKRR